MITQQLHSRAKNLTIPMKDGGLFSLTQRAAVCCSQRCVNANWGEPDGSMSRWEYREMRSVADGRRAPYLIERRQSDHDELRRTGLLDES